MLRKWTSKDPKTEFAQLIPKALRIIGSNVVGQARLLINNVTGRLGGSLTWAMSGEQSEVGSKGKGSDAIGKPSSPNEVWIGTGVEYGPYVEYHKNNYAYLRPAMDKNRKEAIRLLRDAIREDYGK